MDLTIEEQSRIEIAISAVIKYKRPQSSFHNFTQWFSQILAQAEQDKEALILAGYDWEKHAYTTTLFTYLNKIHGDRIAAEGKGSAPSEEFNTKLKEMRKYRTSLSLVLEFIIRETKNNNANAALHIIKKGRTNLDVIKDIIALTAVLKEHPERISSIKPNGKEVTMELLEYLSKEAEELLHLEGEAHTTASERSILVDKVNRTVTLSIEGINEIKLFAKAAFCQNPKYYKARYIYRNPAKKDKTVPNSNTHDDERPVAN